MAAGLAQIYNKNPPAPTHFSSTPVVTLWFPFLTHAFTGERLQSFQAQKGTQIWPGRFLRVRRVRLRVGL